MHFVGFKTPFWTIYMCSEVIFTVKDLFTFLTKISQTHLVSSRTANLCTTLHSPPHNLIPTPKLDTWSHSYVYWFALPMILYNSAILGQISLYKLHISRFNHFMVFPIPFIVIGSYPLNGTLRGPFTPNGENCWSGATWFLPGRGVWIHALFPGQFMHFTLNSVRDLEAHPSSSK